MKRLIWTNEIGEAEMAAARELVAENKGINKDEVSEEEATAYAVESAYMWHEDEECNLNRSTGMIICIADLGLWDGRRIGYKFIGRNLNSVLSCSCGDFIEVYCDAHDVRARDTHHDGTNYYTFREVKEGVDIDNLCDKIMGGTATAKDIAKYTRSLRPYVAEIYGWGNKINVAA